MRVRVCEHLWACVDEDGNAPDGGTFVGCSMPPCDECGALCPGSSWTREGELAEQRREVMSLIDRGNANTARNLLHEGWKAAR